MAIDFVTEWLEEHKPEADVDYLGPNEDDIHIWDLDFDDSDHTFRLGIPTDVVDDDALLSERLMELESQGWLDRAGEKDIWVLIAAAEVLEGVSFFGEQAR
jgi:hypothetical protein